MFGSAISFFLLGLAFGSGPCLASCGPMLISYIVGTKKNVSGSFISYILFSFARISVYLILGLLVFFLGRFMIEGFLSGFSKYIFILGGVFFIFVGVLMAIGRSMEFGFCRFLESNILQKDKKSIILFGLIIGFLPCLPLLSIFSYMGLISSTWISCMLYTFSFGIGTLLSPLLLLVIFAGALPRFFLNKRPAFGKIFSFICGLIIVFLGIQLIQRTL